MTLPGNPWNGYVTKILEMKMSQKIKFQKCHNMGRVKTKSEQLFGNTYFCIFKLQAH